MSAATVDGFLPFTPSSDMYFCVLKGLAEAGGR